MRNLSGENNYFYIFSISATESSTFNNFHHSVDN